MIDRTELDLRLDTHMRTARAMNGHGWKESVTRPAPAPRPVLAALLLRLATRLDPRQGRAGSVSGPLTERAGA